MSTNTAGITITAIITSTAVYTPSPSLDNAQVSSTSSAMYHSENDRSLSTPAAIGIGIAIGIVCTVLVLVTVLLLHRAWRLRRSPPVKQYRQAKLWKGFEPVTPSTARTTFVGTKMTNIYLTELPTPVTPAFLMSPPLRGEEVDVEERSRRYSEPA